jgi:Uma2 family endonuclease
MSATNHQSLLRLEYEKAAKAYERSLPLEHFREAIPQARQRTITLESLDLVKARRSDFHLFNELLVQYTFGRSKQICQVVPDNMVVLHSEALNAVGSYNVPLQPVGPFWVLEYVSEHSTRKDYEDKFQRYERELKVPYYLVFYPEKQDLRLYRYRTRKYVAVKATAQGRYALPELDLEVALLERWVRFWYEDQLLPLPADLQRDLDETRRQLQQTQRQVKQAEKQAENERQQKERLLAQLRALGVEPNL